VRQNNNKAFNDRFTTTNQMNQVAILRQSVESASKNKLY